MKVTKEMFENNSFSDSLLMGCEVDLEGLSIEGKTLSILYYMGMVKLIEQLGWNEHTSDWDPYTEIKFLDGTEHLMTSGYSEITLVDFDSANDVVSLKVPEFIETFEEDDNDIEKKLRFRIDSIKSISLER
jgi:hypothetical protein